MDSNQRNFFTKNIEGKLPWAMGGEEGEVLYVAHNADTQFIKDNLVGLWKKWFEFASNLK
jgi:hypothetical protein